MEQKKYLKAIYRKLRCGSAKKKEIVKQLGADIEAALEKGDSLADIISEIGTPEAVAAEFNEEITEKDRKRGKYEIYAKCIGIVIVVLCLFAAVVWWFLPKSENVDESGRFSEDAVIEQAKKVIAYLDADDYVAMRALMQEQAAGLITDEILTEAKQYIAEDFGAFVAWGNAYVAEVTEQGQHAAAIEISASYEKVGVTYTLFFDEEMQLTGIYMR
ncbi:MAG: DUF3887 domain-containing protein [Lachnospiraceae bacterium]|nr:DUF3887 domain-containing protein [Lachnospiraceae bacterium]